MNLSAFKPFKTFKPFRERVWNEYTKRSGFSVWLMK